MRHGKRRPAVLLAAALLSAPDAGAAAGARLSGVEVSREPDSTRILLHTDAAPRWTEPFSLTSPARLVLDVPGLENATARERFEVGDTRAERVRLGRHPGFLRVVVDLAPGAENATRRVEHTEEGIAIWIGAPPRPAALPPVSASPPRAPPTAEVPEPSAKLAPGPSVRIYGLELQAAADRDRVLVFAEAPLTAEVSTPDASTVLVRLPGATLDASAARRLAPEVGGAVSEVVAFAPLTGGPPEVRIQIKRNPASEPLLSQRGSMLAVELPLPTGAQDVGLTLSFSEAELSDVVREVAKATGERFLFDESLRGRVTVSVTNRVSHAEALEILHAALASKGFAAARTPGGGWRILKVTDAQGASSRVVGAARASGVPTVTTLLRLRSADAKDLVGQLARFAGSEISATAFAPSNSIILAGSEARLHRYASLAQALDEAEAEELAVIALQHRDASEIAAILEEIAGPHPDGETRQARPRFEVWHDERGNTLLLRGSRAELAELRGWLGRLDVAPEGEGSIRVIRPKNADVAKLAELLQKLAAGASGIGPAGGAPRPDRDASEPHAGEALHGRTFQVASHESTGAILVHADPETHRIVREVVDEVDRRPPTVAVDLLVFELDTSRTLALGFDAFVPFGDADSQSFGALLLQGTPGGPLEAVSQAGTGILRAARAPLVLPIVGPGGIPTLAVVPNGSFQITAAEGELETRVLLRPHLLALSGEEHELVAGDNVPVLVGAGDEETEPAIPDPLTIRNRIERRDVGLLLRVRPTAGQEGDVRLEIDVEASRVRPESAAFADRIGPVIQQRKLTAVTRLEHGQVAVLGMLLEPVSVEREIGVPFLRDIPILGWLARSTVTQRRNRQLVIAIEASIERSAEDRLADSIRFRLAFERALARRGTLGQRGGGGYALLVSTRSTEGEARALASALDAGGRAPEIVRWEWDGEPRFDVYLGAFATVAEAVAASEPLTAAGFRPELVALPPHELARSHAPAAAD